MSIYQRLHWQSDWNGDEVGYDEIDVVGLYSVPNLPIDLYLDSSSGKILEVWTHDEEGC